MAASRRMVATSTDSPPTMSVSRVSKASGWAAATMLHIAVVRKNVLIRRSRRAAPSAAGSARVSVSMISIRPPLSSGPHTSKVRASKAGLDAMATTAVGDRSV